jgi:hypothetical protein
MGLLRGARMDNQRQMPWHYSVGGSLLAKRPVQPIHMHGSMHGLREQAPSHRLWVRRGLKACPGFASGVNTQRICAGFRLSMHRPGPWRRCVSVMASFGGYGLLRRGRMDNQRQMPWHYSVVGSLLAKRPVQPIHMHGSMHGLREQAPSHRLWVRRGLKACPGFASGANTQRICA